MAKKNKKFTAKFFISNKKFAGSVLKIGKQFYIVGEHGNNIKLSNERLEYLKENDYETYEKIIDKIKEIDNVDKIKEIDKGVDNKNRIEKLSETVI